jgi:hypothetical protein
MITRNVHMGCAYVTVTLDFLVVAGGERVKLQLSTASAPVVVVVVVVVLVVVAVHMVAVASTTVESTVSIIVALQAAFLRKEGE